MWHCSLAIFFSLMKTKLASLTEYLGFGDHILDVFIKKRKKKQLWRRKKLILAKSKKQNLSFSFPSLPYLRALEMNW